MLRSLLRICLVEIIILVCGCVRGKTDIGSAPLPPQVTSTGSISVNVSGAVNEPGWHVLKRPFTVEQAIKEAGGIDKFERNQNRSVRVIHPDGSKLVIRRVKYESAILEDGDIITNLLPSG